MFHLIFDFPSEWYTYLLSHSIFCCFGTSASGTCQLKIETLFLPRLFVWSIVPRNCMLIAAWCGHEQLIFAADNWADLWFDCRSSFLPCNFWAVFGNYVNLESGSTFSSKQAMKLNSSCGSLKICNFVLMCSLLSAYLYPQSKLKFWFKLAKATCPSLFSNWINVIWLHSKFSFSESSWCHILPNG